MSDQSVDLDAPGWLLPVEAYTSREWFEREQEQLFERCWAYVGMERDLPEVGSYVTVSVGRVPLVVVRGEDGLRAFHNLCRHRGAQLVDGSGNLGHGFSCFYHRWRYALDGRLTGVPQPDQFPELCAEDLGLLPASVGTARGMVFAHVDPDPSVQLDDWLGDVPAALGRIQIDGLDELPTEVHEVQANWKLFVENHVDGYHLWHLHARSITGLDHRGQQWRPSGRHWIFDEPATEEGAYPDRMITGLPLLPGTPPGGFGSVVMLAFPNLGIALGATFLVTLRIVPLEPTRTRIEVRTLIAPLSTQENLVLAGKGVARELRRLVGRLPVRVPGVAVDEHPDGEGADILAEDLRAAEAVQRAMQSPSFTVGPLAKDFEAAIATFQRNVLDHVGSGSVPLGPSGTAVAP